MKTVIITGAAGNLGMVTSSFFLQKNWAVKAIVASEDEKERLERAFPALPLSAAVCSAASASAVQNFFQHLIEPPHAVVHLVGGIIAGMPISETSDVQFAAMMEVNALSTFLILRSSMKIMRNGGSIVTVGAKTALHPEKNKGAYSAAKSAVISLAKTAAEEGKPRNIRVNCIVPGIIVTPSNLEWAENGEEKDWTPPNDIAETIFFLCSDEGRGVNGSIIPMYGKLPA